MMLNNLRKNIFCAFLIGLNVVLSPILRVEGFAPMQHIFNVVNAVVLGPFYSIINAIIVGLLRMVFYGIPPLALTGAVFGAALSSLLYKYYKQKFFIAYIGEVIGTGLVGAIVSYPIMYYLLGKNDLTLLFYVPSFLIASSGGGFIGYLLLKQLEKSKVLSIIHSSLEKGLTSS